MPIKFAPRSCTTLPAPFFNLFPSTWIDRVGVLELELDEETELLLEALVDALLDVLAAELEELLLMLELDADIVGGLLLELLEFAALDELVLVTLDDCELRLSSSPSRALLQPLIASRKSDITHKYFHNMMNTRHIVKCFDSTPLPSGCI